MKRRALSVVTLLISMCLLASPAWAGPTIKKRSWVTESTTLEVRRIGWGVPLLHQNFAPRLNCQAPEVPLITQVHAFPKVASRVRDRGDYRTFDSTRLGVWRLRVVSTLGGAELQASGTGWAAGEANAPAGIASALPFNGNPGGFWLTATFADNSGLVIDEESLLRVAFTVSLTVACGTLDFHEAGPQ